MDDRLVYLESLVMFAAGIALLSVALVFVEWLWAARPRNGKEKRDA